MTTQPHQGQDNDHRVVAVLTWVFGAAAASLTAFFGYLLSVVIQEWAGYVGGESQVALFILGFFGALTLLSWLLTFIALVKARSCDAAARVLGVAAIIVLGVTAAVLLL